MNISTTNIKVDKKNLKERYDKNQGYQKKIKIQQNQVCLEKIEVRCDKNQGYQEKLNKNIIKTKVV